MSLKRYITGLLIILAFLSGGRGISQSWKEETEPAILKDWAVNLSVGFTSYYGDLSTHDDEFFGKLHHESGPAYSLLVKKQIGRKVSVAGQLISGNLRWNPDNASMKTSLFEYNLQGRINLVELLSSHKIYRKFGLTVYAGVGNFIFSTEIKRYYDGQESSEQHSTRVPEFVYFFGGGIAYDLSPRISITSELSIRQCQNDKVDITVDNGDFDYYSFLSFGITYRIFSLGGKFDIKDTQFIGWGKNKPIYRPYIKYE